MATNARDAAVAVALPEELLLDIFLRLSDPLDLLHCAATCRWWLNVIAADNAALLRRAGILPENRNASLLLGAFYQKQYLVPGSATISDCPPWLWRLDDLARPRFGLFSILPNPTGLYNYAKPLASRHGLLLLRLMPVPTDYQKLHLAVCHPILGAVHHVPPPPVVLRRFLLGRDVTGYALLTGYGGECLHDHRQRRLAFRVLFTAVLLDEAVYAYSYSSATGSWSAPIVCPVRGLTMSGPRAGIVDGCGTTHWLYRDQTRFYTLDVSADAARVSLTETPIRVQGEHERRAMSLQPPFPCITQGGKLSLVFVSQPDYNMLKLWTKQDRDNKNN